MIGKPIIAIDKANKTLVHILDAKASGLDCGCVCNDCGGALQAILNTTRAKHFKHHTKANCNPTPESELHLLAKYIISQSRSIYHPLFGQLEYTNPQIEKSCDGFIPDVTVSTSFGDLYIEVIVSNAMSFEKRQFYENKGANVLTINLDKTDVNEGEDYIRYLVLKEQINKGYLPHQTKTDTTNSGYNWNITQYITIGLIIFVITRILNWLLNMLLYKKAYSKRNRY